MSKNKSLMFGMGLLAGVVGGLIAGVLYSINPYIPLFLTLICIISATAISFNFYDIQEEESKQSFKDYIKDLKKGYKFITKSKRLRTLLIMTGAIWGIIVLLDSYQLTLLQDIGASSIQIGIIFAMFELTRGLFSNRALDFNKKFKNKSLTNILLTFATGFILVGIIALSNIPFYTKLIIIVILLLIMGAGNAIDQILAKKYVNNFTSTKILPAIYSAKSICDNIFRTIITLIGSVIVGIYNIDIAMVAMGIFILILTLGLTVYSKDKLGLKPEEYTQKDIYKR